MLFVVMMSPEIVFGLSSCWVPFFAAGIQLAMCRMLAHVTFAYRSCSDYRHGAA